MFLLLEDLSVDCDVSAEADDEVLELLKLLDELLLQADKENTNTSTKMTEVNFA